MILCDTVLPYFFHDVTLLNLSISNKQAYFRFAIMGWQVKDEYPNIDEKHEYLIVDVICKGFKILDLDMPNGYFRFVNGSVINFTIDENNVGNLDMDEGWQLYSTFKCESFEVKTLGIVPEDELRLSCTSNELDESPWYELPIDNQ